MKKKNEKKIKKIKQLLTLCLRYSPELKKAAKTTFLVLAALTNAILCFPVKRESEKKLLTFKK